MGGDDKVKGSSSLVRKDGTIVRVATASGGRLIGQVAPKEKLTPTSKGTGVIKGGADGKVRPAGKGGIKFTGDQPAFAITAINGCKVVDPASLHNPLLDQLWPVRGGAAPIVVTARDTLSIRGAGFAAGAQVVAVGWNGDTGLSLGTIPVGDGLTELQVTAPTVADMQGCQLTVTPPAPFDALLPAVECSYERDSLLMPLILKVRNPPANPGDKPTYTAPVALGIVLPQPRVGEAVVDGQTVKIGTKVAVSRTDTANLGKPIVRCYGYSQWQTLLKDPTLAECLSDGRFSLDEQLIDELKNDLMTIASQPWKAVWNGLAALQAVKPIPAKDVQSTDDGVQFPLQATSFGLNFVVIWRDDIPSRPIPVWNLTFNCSDNDVTTELQRQVGEICSFGPQEVDLHTLDPGQWFPLAIERLVGAANNVFEHILHQADLCNQLSLKFWVDMTPTPTYQSKGLESIPSTEADALNLQDLANEGTRTKALLRFLPDFNGGQTTYTLAFWCSMKLPGQQCGPIKFQMGPKISITQNHLYIPTVGIFLTGPDCGMAPLVLLPADQTLLTVDNTTNFNWTVQGLFNSDMTQLRSSKADGSGLTELAQLRQTILGKLMALRDGLDLLRDFLPHPDWVDQIDAAVNRLCGAAGFCIDTTGMARHLGQYNYGRNWANIAQSFLGSIEEVILIGPPGSQAKFVCRTEQYVPSQMPHPGYWVKFSLPSEAWIAAAEVFPVFTPIDFSLVSSYAVPEPVIETNYPGTWRGHIASIVIE